MSTTSPAITIDRNMHSADDNQARTDRSSPVDPSALLSYAIRGAGALSNSSSEYDSEYDTALYPPTTYYNKFDHDRVYISLDFETKSEGCSTITQAGFAVLRLNEDSRHQLLLSPNLPATTQFVHLRVAESLDYIHTNPTLQRKYNNKRGFRFGDSQIVNLSRLEDALDDQMVKWDFGGTNTTLVLHDRNAEPDICEVERLEKLMSEQGVDVEQATKLG
ncbi:hypothetical protein BKA61DRAFT_137804 [Leptodontidium sp. MPI-SDFR-AT-0119]|nr:hypothetical protein BKA61DRAFT_137804 [Leptodontidium sp. MPI-SDFR-AT-0119]